MNFADVFFILVYIGGAFIGPTNAVSIWDRLSWPMDLGVALRTWAFKHREASDDNRNP